MYTIAQVGPEQLPDLSTGAWYALITAFVVGGIWYWQYRKFKRENNKQ